MPWDIKVILDEGREDIGTISGTYTDDKGNIILSYSGRDEVTEAGLKRFLMKAKSSKSVLESKAASEVILSKKATDFANGV